MVCASAANIATDEDFSCFLTKILAKAISTNWMAASEAGIAATKGFVLRRGIQNRVPE